VAENGLELFRRRAPWIAPVDLVVTAAQAVPLLLDEAMQPLDRRAFGRVRPNVQAYSD